MKTWRNVARSYAIITLGAVVYALAYNFFYAPNDIAMGGVTGLAQMVNRVFGFPPVGVLIIVMNLPLFFLAWKLLGNQMLLGSVWAMIISSVLLDLFGSLFTFPTLEEPLMACIFGGLTMGLALGLICREGASVGGTDIASRLLKLKAPGMSVGQLVLIMDLSVIAGVSLVFQQLNSGLLGITALFISSTTMDRVLMGIDPSKVAYIISENGDAIAKRIGMEMHRGVTILNGAGAWTGQEKHVLLCAFKNRQFIYLKRMIQEMDPAAFLIVCEAYEVLGQGFLKNDLPKPVSHKDKAKEGKSEISPAPTPPIEEAVSEKKEE